MATPDFVLSLRERIGHDPLPLVGTTAVVFRDEKVLLGKRADNGTWQCVAGIVEPGEEPADAAARECLEEAGVVVSVERVALVHALPRITYANGDQVDYTEIVFRCSWVSGEPHPADGELTEVGFYDLAAMGDVDGAHVRKIALAMAEDDPAHFRGGRVRR
ncbi:NUDIX domain-containing protein [Microbacterium sp. ARD32]|uniref:NUDIX hydrolase n=1 Tax=Microbacterium sp. ARD32 TaxID=2962577 RepID=UPI002882208B|nr:NUDIX domain-containing protein [Microbacterium sp. ARD32]MDT0157519.1 NUDIX domain-containing protein [Microbacterium sp. ARD32]